MATTPGTLRINYWGRGRERRERKRRCKYMRRRRRTDVHMQA